MALLRLEPKEISPDGRGNGHGDLAGVGDGWLRNGGPGIRKREVGVCLQLKVQSSRGPRDDHKRIGSRDVQGRRDGSAVKAGNARARYSINAEEVAADEHIAIGLQRNRTNPPVRSCAWIKTAVQTPIGIEPRNVVAIRAVDGGEQTSDEHFAIGLYNDLPDLPKAVYSYA